MAVTIIINIPVIYGESNSELSGGAMWDAYFADGTKNTKYVTPQNYEYARPNYAEFVMFKASFVKLRSWPSVIHSEEIS